ncbi:MAG: L,D-transpeptidase [Duncaniella sp.]|nr:L,D-transpeptidase [Duncaniella sp.]
MKPRLHHLLSVIMLTAISVSYAEVPDDSAPEFSSALAQLIASYRHTAPPALPEPDGWDELDSPVSVAPARMRLPKNIVVDKPNTRLFVINALGDTMSRYRVCASLKRGQKTGKDDWRTPEGTFVIHGVYNSTDWTYKDTKDKCYGPFFISLRTPGFWGIGIHGTNAPSSVPGRRSHGCMRMHNEDIVRVRRMVDKDSRVTILPDPVAESHD